jgi:hypothetical protein
VKLKLDGLIKARRSELKPWWDSMRNEGSS